jgi:hypothetical protein
MIVRLKKEFCCKARERTYDEPDVSAETLEIRQQACMCVKSAVHACSFVLPLPY